MAIAKPIVPVGVTPDERTRPLQTAPGGTGATNPYAGVEDEYINSNFDYDLSLLGSPGNLYGQVFEPMRERAVRTVQGGLSSGEKTGMTALASSGGLSEADKEALRAQSQRQRVDLLQGAQAPIDELQAQNLYDTQAYNVGQAQKIADYNQMIQNQKSKEVAAEYERKAENLYKQRMEDALLERKIKVAQSIYGG